MYEVLERGRGAGDLESNPAHAYKKPLGLTDTFSAPSYLVQPHGQASALQLWTNTRLLQMSQIQGQL